MPLSSVTPDARSASTFSRRLAVAITSIGLAAAALVVAQPASAAGSSATNTSAASSPTAHDPVGSNPTVSASANGLLFQGWAFDPDAPTANVTVAAILDGRAVAATTPTNLAVPAVTAKYKAGPTPGYAIAVPVPAGQAHTVCLVARNVGAGLDAVERCVTTPLGTVLTRRQIAAHSPVGLLSNAWANTRSVHFVGWASDPDYVARPSLVVLYVDGRPALTTATSTYTGARPAAAGPQSKIDMLVPVGIVGTHVGCLWVVNVGLGSNTFLGCRVVDNRTPAGASLPQTPPTALNAQVVKEALKHLGSPYVWGATGPKKFDCSGLVMYSYKKFNFLTPRVSEDQVVAARLIPASHARPGDLVFYHDTQGDVYHVGIYLRPGMTVAAVDPQSGVRYQSIDAQSASYGSFTHT